MEFALCNKLLVLREAVFDTSLEYTILGLSVGENFSECLTEESELLRGYLSGLSRSPLEECFAPSLAEMEKQQC